MFVRVIWAVCLSVGATVSGIGLELYAAGAGRGISIPVVLAGILFVPLSSAVIERLFEPARPPR